MVEAKRPGMTKGSATLHREMQAAANLFAHPLAGVTAMTTIGFGIAGFWMGAMTGMADAAQRMLEPRGSVEAKPVANTAATRARSAAKVLIEDVQSTALEIVGAAAPAVGLMPAAAKELQPEDFRQPKASPKPRKVDDLKAISGVGPKLEKVLNGLGVWTYAQVAGWTAEEIAWVEDYLSFAGRIGRDDWTGQAAGLAGLKKR